MATPMVSGDSAGLFQPPTTPTPPLFSVTAVSGSNKVKFKGLSVMLLGRNTCSNPTYGSGTLTGVSLTSNKVRVEGLPVLLGGSSVSAFGTFPGVGAVITANTTTDISVS